MGDMRELPFEAMAVTGPSARFHEIADRQSRHGVISDPRSSYARDG
jgi:hypothetical protein